MLPERKETVYLSIYCVKLLSFFKEHPVVKVHFISVYINMIILP